VNNYNESCFSLHFFFLFWGKTLVGDDKEMSLFLFVVGFVNRVGFLAGAEVWAVHARKYRDPYCRPGCGMGVVGP
jgi:hypothetical protein